MEFHVKCLTVCAPFSLDIQIRDQKLVWPGNKLSEISQLWSVLSVTTKYQIGLNTLTVYKTLSYMSIFLHLQEQFVLTTCKCHIYVQLDPFCSRQSSRITGECQGQSTHDVNHHIHI